MQYTHLKLNEDYPSGIAGYYTPEKEERLQYNGREVLYVTGRAVIESSCCGTGNWVYALVPGFIINWQNETSERGLPVSEVEPILDEEIRKNIRKTIQANEGAYPVGFW